MSLTHSSLPCVFAALLAFGAASVSSRGDDSASIGSQFAQPPRVYSSGPLWVWNDGHTEQDLRDALRALAQQGIKQAFVHPRFGLLTPYLSEEWFKNWGIALDEARKLDMNIWIYDENSYPSGFAGAWIPEMMPEAKGQGLSIREQGKPDQVQEDIVGVYRLTEKGCDNVTAHYRRAVKDLPGGKYFIALREWAQPQPYFAYRPYVDLLRPGVTEKFLEITLEPYRRRFGDEFGKRVPGVFSDETTYHAAGELPWTPGLPAEFQKRFGYDLLDHLPSLRYPVGDWKKVRHDFCLVLFEQFLEHWAKPYYDYCEENHLEHTGHYFEHDWPNVMGVPDNLSIYPYHQRPAIDALFNSYREHTNHHFGNIRIVKEMASAANQCGWKRTLCEAYGAGGWDLRLEDMKRNGDWLYVGGVNTLNQHLSFMSLRGVRKQDCPQSFSPHAPWWPAYHVLADYFTRLSLALSSGEEVNKVLVIQPTSTAWMYQADPSTSQQLMTVGDGFFDFIQNFSKLQLEYDLGSENSLAKWGTVEEKQLVLQKRKYPVVVLAPHCETLRSEVAELLERFLAGGGKVLCADAPPSLIDARPSELWKSLSQKPGWRTMPTAEIAKALKSEYPETRYTPHFQQTQGLVFHLRRQLEDGQFIFAVNSSLSESATFTLDVPEGTLTEWDLFQGTTRPVTVAGVEKTFTLLPAGSTLLFYSPKGKLETVSAKEPAETSRTIAPLAPPAIARQDLNVLTLDYVDVTAGGETLQNTYFHKANHFVFRQNGMPHGNPWEVTIQFRDETIQHQFPADSGFEATYHFQIEERIPAGLEIVIERPDLYEIKCNGEPVAATKDAWWLDKSFGRIDLSRTARVGENAVVLRAKPMTIYHEIEPAYLRGDFNLKPTAKGFAVVAPQPLTLNASSEVHGQTPDNCMWLTCGIGFNAGPGSQTPSDGAPFVAFDLGTSTNLRAVQIWNYNETNLQHRGAKAVRLTGSTDGTPGSFTIELGSFNLDRATGKPQSLDIAASQAVRFVRIDVLSNQNGVTYPTNDGSKDNAFTGLSKVRFIADPQSKLPIIPNVKIASVSSELTSFGLNRRAQFLVNRDGLSICEGWNEQGLPFYSAGVSYRETFALPEPKGTYSVHLPRWFGSVAAVTVNDTFAGYIFQQPWECDVTKLLKPGENRVEVVVFGTLKNLLGAHHLDPRNGVMGDFSRGPEAGPPPGDSYDVLGYGLFDPYVLRQRD